MSPRSSSPARPKNMSLPSSGGFELGGTIEAVEGTKEERRWNPDSRSIHTLLTLNFSRFLALNPRGTLDYTLPSEGNLSGYLGK